jgi:2-polyprenyl-3-methyl-5-hydroxy-6-metoxy-1,4-benzoquinol methylase
LFVARGYDIARCETCGLVRTLGVSAEDGARQYPAFDQGDTPVVRGLRWLVGQLLRERTGFVRAIRSDGRLLDVGCGNGGFARLMARTGYDVVGVEPFSLGQSVLEPKLRLIRGRFEDHRDSLGMFDIITAWQVIEHLPDPPLLLAGLLEHLQPNGTLIISVPNFASWQSRVFGPRWFHLDPPRHVVHFDRRTLRRLVAKLDLELVRERVHHLEYGPVGWLQSALNLVLPRSNCLYEFVKDRGALAGVPSSEVCLNLAMSAALGLTLAPSSVMVEALASLAGAGAALTVALRRRGRAEG